MIKRYSAALGAQLALVTRDRKVRDQADKLNIPVYKSIRDAEQSRWRPPRKRRKKDNVSLAPKLNSKKRDKPDLITLREQAHPASPLWLNHPVVRIFLFTLGVFSMLVVAAIFIPSAEVYITPAGKTETVTINVNASFDNKIVDISGAVPAYLESVIVEGRGTTPATGETTIPKQSASGRVSFVNLTEEVITIPIGTIVSTNDDPSIRFATTKEGIVPIAPKEGTVPIMAVQPGSTGNVSAGEIVAIEGPLGLNLSVTNRRSTGGGTDFSASAPHKDDFQVVYETLIASLEETAKTEFEFNTTQEDVSLSPDPVHQQILEENYIPEIGDPADFIDLNLRAEFNFPYAAGADLYQLSKIVLDRHINDDFTPWPETLQISQLTQPINQTNGKVSWMMQASWQMGANLNETEAISIILGLEPDQAIQQLNQQIPITSGTEIHLTPGWWPRLPVLPFRIKIITDHGAALNEYQSSSSLQ